MKIKRKLIFTSGLIADKTNTLIILIRPAIVVARATPTIPSFGNPIQPKIKQALRTILRILAVTFTIVLALTRETDFNVLK